MFSAIVKRDGVEVVKTKFHDTKQQAVTDALDIFSACGIFSYTDPLVIELYYKDDR